MPTKPNELLDATPDTKKYFLRRLKHAPIDFESFGSPLKLCTLEECQGMCCYDGVCLDEDEEHRLTALLDAHPVFFRQLGLTSENAFEDATFLGEDTRKTASRPFSHRDSVEFPDHFEKTSCVFRFPDGRCSLQSLAMEHGEHIWAYKPLSCWLHPISLERDDKSVVWVPTKETDLLADEDYPGFAPYTLCGKECPGGLPAYEVLKPELEALGAIIGRDFYGEIKEHYRKREAGELNEASVAAESGNGKEPSEAAKSPDAKSKKKQIKKRKKKDKVKA